MTLGQATLLQDAEGQTHWPVMLCLLGNFRVLRNGQPLPVRAGGKTEALLCSLALQHESPVARDALLEALWPEAEAGLAGQSLNSLVYGLNRQLAGALDGAAPLVHDRGHYRLNVEAGVGVDVACYNTLAEAGARLAAAGDREAAASAYRQAVGLYRGDLSAGSDVRAIMQREHLRARYLTMLAHLADHHFASADYQTCQDYARRLLDADPCREDAHRLVMRCYVRLGERAQALRQYQLCRAILRTEFEALPEPATTVLFDQVRLDPASL